jgi:hypothetical protein
MPLWVSVPITVVIVLLVLGALGMAIDKSARE